MRLPFAEVIALQPGLFQKIALLGLQLPHLLAGLCRLAIHPGGFHSIGLTLPAPDLALIFALVVICFVQGHFLIVIGDSGRFQHAQLLPCICGITQTFKKGYQPCRQFQPPKPSPVPYPVSSMKLGYRVSSPLKLNTLPCHHT